MMKNKTLMKISLLFNLILLTSCGYGLKEIYYGKEYISSNYLENYYYVWDEEIKEGSNKLSTNVTNIDLSTSTNIRYFSKYSELQASGLDDDSGEYNYSDFALTDEKGYGLNRRMSNIDSSFKNGILSKLFDGWMFCGGRYEKARIQVNADNATSERHIPETIGHGFGRLFEKECSSSPSYFAINLRGATDDKYDGGNVNGSLSNVDLKFTFYIRNDGKFDQIVVHFNNANIITNFGGSYDENGYNFLGFELGNKIDLTHCAGFAINYTLNSIKKDGNDVDTTLPHSLMIYEAIFADSNWN